MKRASWALFNCSGVRLAFAFLLLVLADLHSGGALAADRQETIRVRQARFIVSDAATLPPEDAGWQTAALPHRVPKPADRELVGYWYKADFTPADATQPLWLYFPKLRSGGAIYVNGVQVGAIRGADAAYQVRWFRPHLFFLPPLSLREGNNEIAVRFAIREPLTSFGEFEIGPQQPLRESYDLSLFWENTSTEISAIICLLSGAFILVFWLRRPQEVLYGLFGVCVLFWGLRTFIFRLPVVPMEYWVLWRFFYYLTTSGFIVCITLFLLKYSRAENRRLTRFLLAYWLGGSAVFLVVGTPIRMLMDTYWTAGFLPFTTYAIARLAVFTARRPTPSCVAMVLAILIALALALHDFAVQHGWFRLQEYYMLHLGIPAFLLVMACVLMERFIASLKQAESVQEQLARRVAERETELAASYEQLRQLERDHAAAEERQRIMQDMHDGVGSQLLTTLVMAQRGAATPGDMVALLQECLDDMRLAIDSLSPDDPDLLPALGNLRFRMEARFKALGLDLAWRSSDLPDTFEVAPHAGLQILRIVQEALTNVLKHAQARNVEVALDFSGGALRIRIADDGVGFAACEGHSGRGLKNMRSRAQKIGAAFDITHLSPGTAICLDLPAHALRASIAKIAASDPMSEEKLAIGNNMIR